MCKIEKKYVFLGKINRNSTPFDAVAPQSIETKFDLHLYGVLFLMEREQGGSRTE